MTRMHPWTALLRLGIMLASTMTLVRAWRTASEMQPPPPGPRVEESLRLPGRDSISAFVAEARRVHVFGGHPVAEPMVAYHADLEVTALLPQPTVLMPQLIVRAIVGGPPWQAVLSGVPSAGGDHVARPGDRIGELHVVAVSSKGVTVRWADSTWVVGMLEAGR